MNFRKRVLHRFWIVVKFFIFVIVLYSSMAVAVISDFVLAIIAFFIGLLIGRYPKFGKFKVCDVFHLIFFEDKISKERMELIEKFKKLLSF